MKTNYSNKMISEYSNKRIVINRANPSNTDKVIMEMFEGDPEGLAEFEEEYLKFEKETNKNKQE